MRNKHAEHWQIFEEMQQGLKFVESINEREKYILERMEKIETLVENLAEAGGPRQAEIRGMRAWADAQELTLREFDR